MSKDVSLFVDHILDNIENVELFSKGMEKKDLSNNQLKQYALVRAVEVIGEAAKNLPSDFKEKHSDIPWKNIIGTRDIMIHRYFEVNLDTLWNIIKIDLPDLKTKLISYKKTDLKEKK